MVFEYICRGNLNINESILQSLVHAKNFIDALLLYIDLFCNS